MLTKIYKSLKKEEGFTLVELMVVVTIIGVLVGIAVPVYNSTVKNAADKAHEANVRILEAAAQTYLANEGVPEKEVTWDGTESNSDENGDDGDSWESYIKEWPEVPKNAKVNSDGGNKTYKVIIKTSGKIEVMLEDKSTD